MPIRSNVYQRLVAAVHEHVGPGWVITESRMLTDSRTGQPREVDIVVDGAAAGYPLLIGIEARDRGRVADVTWVEAMAKKHDDLPTDKLVLWSPTGFSKSAKAKADALGVVTVTSKTIADAPWARLTNDLIGGSMKWVRHNFTLAVDVYLPSGEAVRWPASRDTVVRRKVDGAELSLGTILSRVERGNELRTAMLDHARDGEDDFHGIFEPPDPCDVTNAGGETRDLKRVVIGLRTVAETLPVSLDTIVHDDVATSLGELNVSDGMLRLVVREPSAGGPSVSVRHVRQIPARR